VSAPASIPVVVGNAGNHGNRGNPPSTHYRQHPGVVLELAHDKDGNTWRCYYGGGASQAHPKDEQVPLGLSYHLVTCEQVRAAGAPLREPTTRPNDTPFLVERVRLRVGQGDSWSPSRERPETTVEFTLAASGVNVCADVKREGGFTVYPASAEMRAKYGVAQWRMGSPAQKAFVVTFVGEDEGGRPRLYGSVSADMTRASDEVLPPEALFRSVVALDGTDLPAAEQQAILRDAIEKRPSDECFGLERGPEAARTQEPSSAPVPQMFVASLNASAGGNGEPWTCRNEQIAYDLAKLKAAAALLSGGNAYAAAASALLAARELECCQGRENSVTSLGEQCGCAARTGGQRPILESRMASGDTFGALFEYQCVRCPSDRPRWSAERNRCEGCPNGQRWNPGEEACVPADPGQGGGDAPTLWRPNTTDMGFNPECWYRVKLEFLMPGIGWSRSINEFPNYYQVYTQPDAVGVHEHWNCFAASCEPLPPPQNNILVKGPIYGVGLKTETRPVPPEPNFPFDREYATSFVSLQDGQNGLREWVVESEGCFEPGCTARPPFTDVRIAGIDYYDGPVAPVRSCGAGSSCWILGQVGVNSECSRTRPPEVRPTFPPPPVDEPPPTCGAGKVLDANNGCSCPPDGPQSESCACEHGQVWDPGARACVDNGIRCFGAVGEDCTPIQASPDPSGFVTCPAATQGLPPEGARCVTDVHWDPVEGTSLHYQAVSVGSIEHDQCCADHPDGFFCGGEGDEPWHCFAEFGRATADVLGERTWPVLFDTNEALDRARAAALDDRYFAQLRAPFGTRMSRANARFCQSGEVVQGLEGETVCAPTRAEAPLTEPVVSATPAPREAPLEGAGSCERFAGTRQELRPVVSAHQAYVRDLGEVRGTRYDDMAFYFAALPSAPGEIWIWRDARGTPRALARVAPQHAPASWTIQPGWEIAAMASAARGAGPALLDCLLKEFDKLGRLPLGARPAAQSVDWWAAQTTRRNSALPGTADWDETAGRLFHSPHELDTFVRLGDGATVSRNVECIEGLYSRYAIAITDRFEYRIRFSPPLGREQAAAFDPGVLVQSLLAGGIRPAQIQNVGWASYAEWDRYAGPASNERSIRFTDRNFCSEGRAFASSELLADDAVDFTPRQRYPNDPDFAWLRPEWVEGESGFRTEENAFEVMVAFWMDEEDRRRDAGLPPLRQAFFRSEGRNEVQELRGPNAPGPCDREPVAAPLQPMQSHNPNFFAFDCFNGIPYWGDRRLSPDNWRDTYEVTSSGGQLVWRASRPNHWNAGDPVTVLPTVGVDRPSPTWVLSPDNRLFVIPGPVPGRDVAHSQTMSGGAVLSAGEIEVERGVVRRVTNGSGHYRPTCESLDWVRTKLRDLGVSVPDARFACIPD
jgi:hypothetical protein